jgi:hypothetical protein
MSSTDLFNFTATAQGVMADFAVLTLYDGSLTTVESGYGYISCRIPKGLYKLTLTLNDASADRYIRVEQDVNEYFQTPSTASALVADGFKDTYEYYSVHVNEYSLKSTADLGNNDQVESLFIFFRYPDEDTFKQLYYAGQRLTDGFMLLDGKRRIICDFRPETVQEEMTNYGWLAFNTRLTPGNYYLYYGGRKARLEWNEKNGQSPREMPLYVYKGWQTQCFMTFGKGPLFNSLTLSMANADISERQFYNDNNELQYLDGILQKFRNGIYYLPDDVLLNLAHEKFKNPILGLLAAYAYFKSGKQNNEVFFRTVVNNLIKLFGAETPDMVAIKLLASAHFDQPLNDFSQDVTTPGIMLPGFMELLRMLPANNQTLIKPGSIAEKASIRLLYDMVWTSYKPITLLRTPEIAAGGKRLIRNGWNENIEQITVVSDLEQHLVLDPNLEIERRSRKSRAIRRPHVLSSWLCSSLLALLEKAPEKISLAELASQLQVTQNLLLDIAKKIIRSQEAVREYLSDQNDEVMLRLFSTGNIERLTLLVRPQIPPIDIK